MTKKMSDKNSTTPMPRKKRLQRNFPFQLIIDEKVRLWKKRNTNHNKKITIGNILNRNINWDNGEVNSEKMLNEAVQLLLYEPSEISIVWQLLKTRLEDEVWNIFKIVIIKIGNKILSVIITSIPKRDLHQLFFPFFAWSRKEFLFVR